MLCLSKNTDYALTALAHLAEHPGRILSAREIAQAHDLPLPLLMKLLKRLHRRGILSSTRGTNGGYQIAVNLDQVSLYDLLDMLEKEGRSVEDRLLNCNCDHESRIEQVRPVQGPFQAFYYKLIEFLKEVKLSNLVLPGRRIDVPLQSLIEKRRIPNGATRRVRRDISSQKTLILQELHHAD